MAERGIPTLLLLYIGIIASLFAAVWLGALKMTDASGSSGPEARVESTALHQRIKTAQDIKHALAKPVAQPGPLPQITKPEHVQVEHPKQRVAASKPKHHPLSKQAQEMARDAFASADVPERAAVEPFDRHRPW